MVQRNYLGFYVHHHGSGHLTRTLQVMQHLPVPVKLLSSKKPPDVLPENVMYIHLPMDVDTEALSGTTPNFLHYAATRSNAINKRMRLITEMSQDIRLLVVDVSAEVTMLARLLSIPTLVTRMRGNRNDPAHLNMYESAESLLAPYPQILEQPDVPNWVVDKTFYTGGFSKSITREKISTHHARSQINSNADKLVVVATSLGGEGIDLRAISKLAQQTPEWMWCVVGIVPPAKNLPNNVQVAGVQRDIWPYLCAADVVVGSGGYNLIMEIASVNKPAILLPENRPYDEQYHNALSLQKTGIACMFETIEDFIKSPVEDILDQVRTSPLLWSQILDKNGAQKIAGHILQKYEHLVW